MRGYVNPNPPDGRPSPEARWISQHSAVEPLDSYAWKLATLAFTLGMLALGLALNIVLTPLRRLLGR